MNERPLISVIMGAYNCAASIGVSIESIQAQSYSNWELIICDDCSTDNTADVVKQYAQEDGRIILIRNEVNKKLPYTLNRCLEAAKGDFIARMDTDDISLPDRFERQLYFLQTHPDYQVVGGAIIPFDEESEKKPRVPKEKPQRLDLIKDVPFYHPTIMMRKEAYDVLGGYTVKERTIKGQDVDLWFRFYARGYKGYNLQEPVLMYHESVGDYKKKRSVKAAWGMTKTRLIGFRSVKIPFYYFPFAFKPLVAALVPRKLMHYYHNRV